MKVYACKQRCQRVPLPIPSASADLMPSGRASRQLGPDHVLGSANGRSSIRPTTFLRKIPSCALVRRRVREQSSARPRTRPAPASRAACAPSPASRLRPGWSCCGHAACPSRKDAEVSELGEAVEHARCAGADRLLLGVYAGNDSAIQFYRRQSFVHLTERKFIVGSRAYDDYVMSLTLR